MYDENVPMSEMEIFDEKLLQHRIDSKTKPLGSLGVLEKIAFQIGSAHCTSYPILRTDINCRGLPLDVPGQMSVTLTVLPSVPFVRQSSRPELPSSALK